MPCVGPVRPSSKAGVMIRACLNCSHTWDSDQPEHEDCPKCGHPGEPLEAAHAAYKAHEAVPVHEYPGGVDAWLTENRRLLLLTWPEHQRGRLSRLFWQGAHHAD